MTVLLAFLVFGEMLSAVQLAGGALVVGGVLVLHVRLPRSRRAGTPATSPACVNQT